MASKLQCEICGGKLVGKPGGIFECENCGTEYSTEWAKAKIQEITGTVKVEGTVEVTGKVKVENGGPSAESLVKRGMMALEDLPAASCDTEEDKMSSCDQKREIKGLFDRALEIEPENGDAYWGKFLLERGWNSSSVAIEQGKHLSTLPDEPAYERARRFAKGETLQTIRIFEKTWKDADQSSLLPTEMQDSFVIRDGELRKTSGLFSATVSMIPEGVTKIGRLAFEGCTEMTYITLPESILKIGEGAFYGCTGLTSVIIPDGVNEIGTGAFYGCAGLTSVTIPKSVTEIGAIAFQDCTGLTSVTIPKSVTKIGVGAFAGCTELTNVTISEGVTEIGKSAFCGCTGLTSVTIPESATKIGEGVFEGCMGLTICARAGSAAEKTAKEERIRFERLKTDDELAAEEKARRAAAEKAEAEHKAAAENAEAERKARIEALNEEKAALQAELSSLKGLFTGKRRKEIEARLAEIEAELKKLG